jgi:hypothetical protein
MIEQPILTQSGDGFYPSPISLLAGPADWRIAGANRKRNYRIKEMKMRKYSWSLVFGTLLFVPACSKTEPSANNASAGTTVVNNNVPIAQQLNVSQGTQTVITPPAEVVAQFLDCLRRGDEVTTEQLLTKVAREEVAKHELEVAPPGSPTATFQIGETREVETGRALVESMWTEPSADGKEPTKTGVVFDVRLEEGGWRLAGMVIDMGANSEAIIVDFENISGLLQAPPNENPQATPPANPQVAEAAQSLNQAINQAASQAFPNAANVAPQNNAPGFSAPPQLASPPNTGSTGLRR